MKPALRTYRRPLDIPMEDVICVENKYHLKYHTYDNCDQYYFQLQEEPKQLLGLQIWSRLGHISLTYLGELNSWKELYNEFDPDFDEHIYGGLFFPINPNEFSENWSVYVQSEDDLVEMVGVKGFNQSPINLAKKLLDYIEL